MPLPCDVSLSLHGYSRPGDAVQSKPKQAMIVRMSDETFDALEASQNHPLQFEFGPTSGIHIGEQFFPMRTQKENSSHELYLRVSSASKPTVPLKNYANVTGKFFVERELDEKVTDKVRTQTIEAEKQRTERKAIMLDAPPTLGPTVTTAKKRKAQPVSMFRKPLPNAAASVSGTALSSAGRSPVKDDGLRKRVIDYLALKRALVDDVVVSIVGQDRSPTQRQEIIALIQEVAEPADPPKKGVTINKMTRPWRLKLKSWLEVRPYEIPSLSEAERTSMARQARFAYNDMKIPDSDPVWDHVRYRKTNSSGSPTPQPSATKPAAAASLSAKVDPPTKRAGGTPSTDTKEKNVKPKTKVDISSIKDEGMRSSKVGASAGTKMQEKAAPVHRDDGPSTSSKVGGARKSLDLQARPERSSEPTSKPPAPSQPDSRPAQKVPRGRETPVSSLPPKPAVQPGHTKVIDSSSLRVPKNGENGSTTKKNDEGKDSSRDGRVLSSHPDKSDRPSDSDRDRERDRDRPRDGRIPKERDSREDFDSDRDRTVRTVKKQRDSREDFVDSDRDRNRVGRIPKRERDVDSDRDRLRDGPVSKERDLREDVVDSGRNRTRDGRIPKKQRQSRDDYHDTDGERGERRYVDGRIPRNKAGEDSNRKAIQKERDWDRGKGRDKSPVEDDRSGSLKRKKPIRDLEDEGISRAGPQKKGKTEVTPAPIPSSSRQSRPDLDLSLPKKPDLGPPIHPTLSGQKFKKESSPLPPRAVLPARPITAPTASSAQAQSNSHRHVSSSKLRRKSPIYTSSEDEGEIREDLPRGAAAAPRGSSNSARGFESKPAHAPVPPSALPPPRLPPADVAGLRSRYQKRWQEYIVVYSSLAAERAKTEALLKQESDTDSDWEGELLDADELEKLTVKHQTLRADLMEMQRVWTGSVDVSC